MGDSLLEPFWPTGTGCARGFFGGLDACWLMRSLHISSVQHNHRPGNSTTALEAIAERESIYRVLAQTTPENTSKDYASCTCDPHTRYPTLNTKLVSPMQIAHLVDTDNPSQLEEDLRICMAKHRNSDSNQKHYASANINMPAEGNVARRLILDIWG